MKRVILSLLCLQLAFTCAAQDLELKNISDTMLLPTRKLDIRGPFDSIDVLKKLFPGKYYLLKNDPLVNWKCPACKSTPYKDANEDPADNVFPLKNGVATRVINVMSYKDSAGTQYKMIAFNHSDYDPEGLQVSRFTGGIIGLAKFALSGDVWSLKFFQPAIGAYGSYSNCPPPKLLLIGHDQYAFMIKFFNGGAGGPFDGSLHLLAGTGGAYQEILSIYGAARTKVPVSEDMCDWECEYTAPESNKRFFRDIIVTMKGTYTASDKASLPEEVQPLVKKKRGTFTATRRYVFSYGKGYQLQGAPVVKLDGGSQLW